MNAPSCAATILTSPFNIPSPTQLPFRLVQKGPKKQVGSSFLYW